MVIYLIKDYEIKFENDKEVLYLYIDFNSEFARLDSKNKRKKLKNYIKDYIKRHNINFKGTNVAIMVSGVLIGTIILNRPIDKNKQNIITNQDYIVAISDNDKDFNDNISTKKEEYSLKIENINDDENNKVISNDITQINKNNDYKQQVEVEVKVEEEKIKENVDIEKNPNEFKVDVFRTNGEVLNIHLEEYLVGVVGAEMPASFNIQALKAQAVIARTYALKIIDSGKKLTDNSSTQNFKTNDDLRSMWGSNYNTYYNKVKNAVDSTKGEYLSFNGNYIEAVYHSTSNGKTEDSKYVWGNSFPYLVSVDSQYDSTNKSFLYEITFTNEEVSKKLGQLVNDDTIYNIISRNESGRVENIFIDNILFSGVDVRTKLGLRSTDFDIEKINGGIKITTRGYGHGVGLSQYGANGMANNGYDYKSILLYYYKGVNISYR